MDNRHSAPGTSTAKPLDVVLYTRRGCHLCDVAHDQLRKYGVHPTLIDIDQDAQLVEQYNECVPVVVMGGKVRFRGRINEILLKRLLRSGPLESEADLPADGRSRVWRPGTPRTGNSSARKRSGIGVPSLRRWRIWFEAAWERLVSPTAAVSRKAVSRKAMVPVACPRNRPEADDGLGSRCLGIMAKYWEPGKSKTRLGMTIGDGRAAELSRRFLMHLLHNLRHQGDARILVYSPDDRGEEFRQLCDDPAIGQGMWGSEPQGPGDLGVRMERFVRRARERGAEKVILVGSDMPTIPTERIEEAWEALDDYPVVLGPAEDGGYYLLGISGEPPPLFAGVPWGTAQVFAWTQHLLNKQGLAYHPLAVGYDVDRWEDLIRLHAELIGRSAQANSAEHPLRAAVEAIIDSVGPMGRGPVEGENFLRE